MLSTEVNRAVCDLKDALKRYDGDAYCIDDSAETMASLDDACRDYLKMRNLIATEYAHAAPSFGFSGSRNEADEFYQPAHHQIAAE